MIFSGYLAKSSIFFFNSKTEALSFTGAAYMNFEILEISLKYFVMKVATNISASGIFPL